MKIFFRVDASIEIGLGHVMRCLTLAHELKANGADCLFICRDHPGHLAQFIRENGFTVHLLSHLPAESPTIMKPGETAEYADWLGTTQELDAKACRPILIGRPSDLLVVDHYALDAAWESVLFPYTTKIMAIDDLADRPHVSTLLLDQNPGRSRSDYEALVPEDCAVMAGPKYALLRPEFARLRADSLEHRKNPTLKNLLISMGGVDKANHTTRVLRAIRRSQLRPDCEITVVMGSSAPWLEQVRQEVSDLDWPVTLRIDVRSMAGLMKDSDLAIGASGITALERCCLGLPTLAVIAAKNQIPGARALEALGALTILDPEDETLSDLPGKLSVCAEPAKLSEMQYACSNITDGTGAAKVARELAHARC